MVESGIPRKSCLMIDWDEQFLQWIQRQSCCDYLRLGRDLPVRTFCPITPKWARQAATDGKEEIIERIGASELTFVAAGLGGGFGTGAAPVIARICKEAGSQVVTITSLPFPFEGKKQLSTAQAGARELQAVCDLNIQVCYEELLSTLSPSMSMTDAYQTANEMFRFAVGRILAMRTEKITSKPRQKK